MTTDDVTVGLDADIAAYESMRADLETHHMGKWVLFHGAELIDTFDTLDNAANEAVRRFGRGPYLLRQVGADKIQLPASVMYTPVFADAAG